MKFTFAFKNSSADNILFLYLLSNYTMSTRAPSIQGFGF